MTADLNILIRVEKLLAKAADPACTEAERDAFQVKAFELIERHRIDEASIGGHLAADDHLGTFPLGDFNGIYGRVRIQVVNTVATHYDVHVFWSGYGNKRHLKAYGFKSDVDRVTALTNRLLLDADTRVARVAPSEAEINWYNPAGDRYKSWQGAVQAATICERRGFYLGYADAIYMRLATAANVARAAHRQEAGEETSASAALVLVDRKRQVNDAFRAAHGAIKSAGSIDYGGSSGRAHGIVAGSQADLTVQNSVRGQRALPGGGS